MKKVISILLTLVFAFLIINQLDFHSFINAFKSLKPVYLLIFIPAYIILFIVRGIRWKVLLPDSRPCKFTSILEYLFIGYFLNCFLPARAGDLYRSFLLGQECGITKVKALTSVVLERIFDGSVVLFFLLYSIVSFYKQPWIYELAFFVGLFFWGGFLMLFILAKYNCSEKIISFFEKQSVKLPIFAQKPFDKFVGFCKKHITSFVDGLSVFRSIGDLLYSFFLTTIIWVIEAGVIYIVVKSYGHSIGFISGVFTMSLAVFCSMIPVTSTFVGPYQYAFIMGLGAFGLSKEQALAVSFTAQFIVLGLITFGGIIALFHKQISLGSLKKEISDPGEELTL